MYEAARALFRVRFIQLYREARSSGPLILIPLLLLVVYLTVAGYKQFQETPSAWYICGAYVVLLLAVHIQRKDFSFLKHLFLQPSRYLAAEYIWAGSPVWLLALVAGNFRATLLLLVLSAVVAFIPVQSHAKTRLASLSRFTGPSNFEWTAGIRKMHVSLVILLLIGIAGVYFPYFSLFVIWLITGLVSSFYVECESAIMIQHTYPSVTPAGFLWNKIKGHSKLYGLLVLPIVISYAIFQFDSVFILLGFMVYQYLLLVFFITTKYSQYEPAQQLTASQITTSIALISVLMPVLFPVFLLMIFRNLASAKQLLKTYFV